MKTNPEKYDCKRMMTMESNGSCSYLDSDAYYISLSDEPITDREKQFWAEAWNKEPDEFYWYLEQCTTKEGYRRLHTRQKSLYLFEDWFANLDYYLGL